MEVGHASALGVAAVPALIAAGGKRGGGGGLQQLLEIKTAVQEERVRDAWSSVEGGALALEALEALE